MFKFCQTCGNLVMEIEKSGVSEECCGEPMVQLVARSDESVFNEKHVPVCELDGKKLYVSIGNILHPSKPDHYIKWVCLVTDSGFQMKYFKPTEDPITFFRVNMTDKILRVYAFCNIHGLWVYDFVADEQPFFERDVVEMAK